MRAWLTPNAPSGSPVGRVLYVPVEYLPSVNGALEQLREAYSWEQYGSQTPDQAAAAMGDMIDAYYESEPMEDIAGREAELPVWLPYDGSGDQLFTSASQLWGGGYWVRNPATINNYVSWRPYLSVGRWEFLTLGLHGSASGIATFKVNGVAQQTIDHYSAAVKWNEIGAYGVVMVETAGPYELALQALTKNALSTGYAIALSAVSIKWVGEL